MNFWVLILLEYGKQLFRQIEEYEIFHANATHRAIVCHDQRSLFRKANSLLGLRKQQALPPHPDKTALSQELVNFFVL